MGKTIAITQSNYIPWKGYFDLINQVDEFILYDDVQYTKNDWRNRNQIKTHQGLQWLTIPVQISGKLHQAIKDARTVDQRWAHKHWKNLNQNYRQAAHFETYREIFESLYLSIDEQRLSQINYRFIQTICNILNIETPIKWVMDYELPEFGAVDPGERLVTLCQQAGASQYVSGYRAKNYLDESLFEKSSIQVEYIYYEGYPEYEQLYPPFDHHVSILDLVFNMGPDAPRYMKTF